MPRTVTAAFLLVVALVACDGDEPATGPEPVPPGASSAGEAVEELHTLLAQGDFDGASGLAVPDHAALASLAEGATFAEVADALRTGDASVAANFWSGFAQGVGESFLGEIEIAERGTATQGDTTFGLVSVTPAGGAERTMVTQDVDGYRVDLFGSFGPGLAARMITPVELLLTSATPDAALILSELGETVDSLLLSANQAGLSPEEVQAVLQLVELITRVG